jgi:hypothetical protein
MSLGAAVTQQQERVERGLEPTVEDDAVTRDGASINARISSVSPVRAGGRSTAAARTTDHMVTAILPRARPSTRY